jgi:hypothetical protein
MTTPNVWELREGQFEFIHGRSSQYRSEKMIDLPEEAHWTQVSGFFTSSRSGFDFCVCQSSGAPADPHIRQALVDLAENHSGSWRESSPRF